MSDAKSRLKEFHQKISDDLQRSVDFWIKYSHDEEHGGFINCVGADGKVYDDTKYSWFQSRQVYTYASILRTAPDVVKDKAKMLKAAESGAEFLMNKVKNSDTSRCYFMTTRDGRPIKYQNSIFTETFYTMAMLELYEVTKKDIYQKEGIAMLDKIIYWAQVDDTELGNTPLAGHTPSSFLAVPMVLLHLCQLPLPAEKKKELKNVEEKCVKEILSHIQREGSVILEYVSPDGKELPNSFGRHLNPGHAIECGWFLLQYAISTGDKELQKTAIEKFIVNPFKGAWDEKYGGLFHMLDVDGFSPTPLGWDMKLWWPHTEVLIGFMLAWKTTQDSQFLEKFQQVFDYCHDHFVDKENGDWFGYLNRRGEVTHSFKGGPWKGCFHAIRYQIICRGILHEAISNQ
ncbi:hypothetical protein SNE40_013613 [Patella caerulea]|uniref:N-acylglucosamine 2-epimerase n=1 Tax=Patella caerulea TaxID=87958 RepID=A0AAN8PB59_PATCE